MVFIPSHFHLMLYNACSDIACWIEHSKAIVITGEKWAMFSSNDAIVFSNLDYEGRSYRYERICSQKPLVRDTGISSTQVRLSSQTYVRDYLYMATTYLYRSLYTSYGGLYRQVESCSEGGMTMKAK